MRYEAQGIPVFLLRFTRKGLARDGNEARRPFLVTLISIYQYFVTCSLLITPG